MFFRRALADSDSEPVASEPEVLEVVLEVAPEAAEEPAVVFIEQEAPVETPVQATEPEPAPMPQKLSEADVEAVKQELVQEMIDKLSEIEGAILPEVTTAPYDPRFPTTNQNRHCFIRYNEFYKCKFERGAEDQRCLFYKRAYQSLCPPEWLEEWEELRDQGLWFGKY